MSGLALLLATQVAAGGVVDVSAGAEARGTQLGSADEDVAGAALTGAFVLRPAISGAVEDERGALRAGYTPQLSFVSPATQLYMLMHTADVGADVVVGPRLRLRAGATGAVGDLDPAGAQAALQGTSAVLAPLVSLPYAAAAGSAGAVARLARTAELDVEARADTTQSPGDATLPATSTAALDTTLAWQLGRMDGALFGLRARASGIHDRGSFSGATAVVGWRRLFGRSAGLDVVGGAGPFYVDAGEEGSLLLWLPTGEARLRGVLDLPGESAVELVATGSIGAVADPLGALLEERGAASAGAVWRVMSHVAVRAEIGGFGPLLTVGRPPNALASTSLTSTGGIAWTINEHLAVEAGLLGTTRIVTDRPVTDFTLSVAMVGRSNVFHTGGRPAGSEAALGRTVGETSIGAPPPPNRPFVDEPPPALFEPAVEEPPLPPELEPPPGYVPEAEPPPPAPATPTLRKRRDDPRRLDDARTSHEDDSSGEDPATEKRDDRDERDGDDDGDGDDDEDDDEKIDREPTGVDDGVPASRDLVDAPG